MTKLLFGIYYSLKQILFQQAELQVISDSKRKTRGQYFCSTFAHASIYYYRIISESPRVFSHSLKFMAFAKVFENCGKFANSRKAISSFNF